MAKGYVQLCTVGNLTPIQSFKKKLFIVRSPGKFDYAKYNLIHVPHLSPSPELFNNYLRWRDGNYTDSELRWWRLTFEGQAPRKIDWWDFYVPQFIDEMRERPEFQASIRRIMQLLDESTNVGLVCFCGDVTRCHRGIIGYFLERKGYEVRYDVPIQKNKAKQPKPMDDDDDSLPF